MESVGRRRRNVVVAATAPLFALATLAGALVALLLFYLALLFGGLIPGVVTGAILLMIFSVGIATSGLFVVWRLTKSGDR